MNSEQVSEAKTMATILKKRYTSKDSTQEIIAAIHTLAADTNGRILKDDQIEWLGTKLKEIKRLATILAKAEG